MQTKNKAIGTHTHTHTSIPNESDNISVSEIPHSSIETWQKNVACILTKVCRWLLFLCTCFFSDWVIDLFSGGSSVIFYVSAVCVAISCGSCRYSGRDVWGWPRWRHAMNYSSFGLTLSGCASFLAINAYTHDDVLKCVCVSRCQKVHTCLIAIFQFLLKTLAYPFSLIIVFVAFLYLIPPQCFHQWSHGIINLKHHYMALPRCTSNIKDLPDLTVKHLWAYLKFLKPLIME